MSSDLSSPIASSSRTPMPPSPTPSSCSSLPDVPEELYTFTLPDLIAYCPFELKLNPHEEAGSAESNAWFDSFDIHRGQKRAEFFNAKFGLLTSMSYPEADYERYRNCCDFISWLFAFDDLTDDGGLRESIDGAKKAASIMMKALRNPTTYKTEFKVGETLRSFWERACTTASEGTQRRFVDRTQLYVDAICEQVVNRRHDQIPNIEEFIQLRRDTSAVKLCYALVEYSLGLDLPDEVFEDPTVQALEQGGNDILTWANDIYSFNVEQAKGDTQNLVIIAMNEHGLDLQGAVDYVGDLIKARIDQYCQDKAMLPSFGSEEVDAQLAQYIQGLEHWVIGVLHWSFDCERYFGAEHARIKQDLTVTLLPVDTSVLPAGDSLVVEDDEEIESTSSSSSSDADVESTEESTSSSSTDVDSDDSLLEDVRLEPTVSIIPEDDAFCVHVSPRSLSVSWKPGPTVTSICTYGPPTLAVAPLVVGAIYQLACWWS